MSDKKIVYWAPDCLQNNINWNILYPDLKNLYDTLAQEKSQSNGFFRCPSFIKKTKNIFVVKNPIHSKFIVENNLLTPISKSCINSNITHEESIKNNILIDYGIHLYFFSEYDIELSITSPFFEKADHLKYGAVVPGQFNISSWFRRVNIEFNLWNGNNELEIKENESILYCHFEESSNIELRRFTMNKSLYDIAESIHTSSFWEPNVSLKKRYQRFKNSRTNELVLKEIKNNIL